MAPDWAFGDDIQEAPPVEPGLPRCHHCGEPVTQLLPDGQPERQARCRRCKFHLHTCPNCAFYSGLGCLLFSPFMFGESGLMGQDCPYFTWRHEKPLSPEEIEAARGAMRSRRDAPRPGE